MWRLQLAELTIEEGAGQTALPLLEQLISEGNDLERAHCLRGEVLAEMERCAEAVTDLETCSATRLQARFAAPLVECQTKMESWEQANNTLLALDPGVRSQREFTRLGRRVQRALKKQESLRLSEVGASNEDIFDTTQTEMVDGDPNPPSSSREEEAATQRAAVPITNPNLQNGNPDPGSLGGESGTDKVTKEGVVKDSVARDRAARDRVARDRVARDSADPRSANPRSAHSGAPAPPASSPARNLSSEDEARLAEARNLLSNAKKVADLVPALTLAQSVADAYPHSRRAQHLVAEIAYRGSLWEKSATYFRRGGDPGENRPNLLFFMAISFYESGDSEAAEGALKRALPKLKRTSFVEDYIEKILSESGS